MDLISVDRVRKRIITLIMYFLAFIWLVPFITLIKKTLLGGGFSNYIYILTNKVNNIYIPFTYVNSFIIALFTCVITLTIASLAAFGFSKLEMKHKNLLFNVIIVGLATPAISIVIPMYFLYNKTGLLNTRISVIIAQIALYLPMSILILRNFFDSLPKALMESSKIDGASNFQVFYYIFLPLAKPAIANLGVLTVSWSFKDFLVPLIFITDVKLYPATVSISALVSEFSSSLTNIGRYNTALCFLAIPPLIIYVIGRKYFEKGLVSGALKD